MSSPDDLTYSRYLRLDDLLSCQHPLTDSDDELLFVIIHQVYELWFKQILHETELLQRRLETGNSAGALHTARRIAKILKTAVGQMDVLETMTPQQFAAFRPELGSSSGFQSSQFRYIEAVFGRRDFSAAVVEDPCPRRIMGRRPVFASLLCYLTTAGWQVPAAVLDRDPRRAVARRRRRDALLAEVYADAGTPPKSARLSWTSTRASRSGATGTSRWSSGSSGEVRDRRLDRRGVPARHAVPARLPRPVGDPLTALNRRRRLRRPSSSSPGSALVTACQSGEPGSMRVKWSPHVSHRYAAPAGSARPPGRNARCTLKGTLPSARECSAEHRRRERHRGHRVGEPVLLRQVRRAAAHQVERGRAAVPSRAQSASARTPAWATPLSAPTRGTAPGAPGASRPGPPPRRRGARPRCARWPRLREVPDGQVREQVDPGGDVLERRRPAAARRHPPVLQVPHRVSALRPGRRRAAGRATGRSGRARIRRA